MENSSKFESESWYFGRAESVSKHSAYLLSWKTFFFFISDFSVISSDDLLCRFHKTKFPYKPKAIKSQKPQTQSITLFHSKFNHYLQIHHIKCPVLEKECSVRMNGVPNNHWSQKQYLYLIFMAFFRICILDYPNQMHFIKQSYSSYFKKCFQRRKFVKLKNHFNILE